MQLENRDELPPDEPEPHDPYAALKLGNFRRYFVGNLTAVLGLQMQAAALNWEVYHRTNDVFMLGLVGLVQVIPVLSLVLFAGHLADRVDRRRIMYCALALMATASLGLALTSYWQLNIVYMYVCLAMIGVARAFHQPAKTSFVPQIVPRDKFPNAVTWSLGAFQFAQMLGPYLGAMLMSAYGHAYVVYLIEACAATTFIVMLAGVNRRQQAAIAHETATLNSLAEGIGFVLRTRVVLGAMVLDMFGVLLGGATALLPVYARDILEVDEVGYGWLLSAPAAGALAMSLVLMHRPPLTKAGRSLLLAVTGFGTAIIVFGLSRNFALSFVALVVTGACDSISVVVRHTLLQMQTPDHMRGRVSSISGMFISASNELGEFESGLVAKLTTPVFAVVSGGVGTLIVVAATALGVPQLRRYGRLDGRDLIAGEQALQREPADVPVG